MKPLNKFPKEFFDRYKEKPVRLFPYSKEMKELGDKYIRHINKLLTGEDFLVQVIGSVAYEIPASDVEIAIYIDKRNWEKILNMLINEFGDPANMECEFARFEILGEQFVFDIHVYCGYEAEVSKKMTEYILKNPNLINDYAELKSKYSFSKREYQYQKNAFLEKVIEEI